MSEYDAPGHDALEQRQPAIDAEEPVADGGDETDLEAPADDVAEQHETLHGTEHGGPTEHSVELDPADAAGHGGGAAEPFDEDDEDEYR
jgi:hypothetical protein